MFKIAMSRAIAFTGLATFSLTAICLITACTRGGPSEQEISNAYRAEVDFTNQQSKRMQTGLPPITVNNVEKLKCTEFLNQGAYRCQVMIDTTFPVAGRMQTQTTLILKPKGNREWMIDRLAAHEQN